MSFINDLINELKETVSVDASQAKYIAGNEDVSGDIAHRVEAEASNITESVAAAFASIELGNEEVKIEPYQVEAAKIAAKYAIDPINTIRRFATKGREDVEIDAGIEAINVDTAKYTPGIVQNDELLAGIEAFDGQDVSASMYFSVAFNALTIKQEPVVDLFYPVIVMDPNKVSATVTARITNIMKTIKRDVSGKPVDFKKESIIKQLNNTNLFTLDANRLYPVLDNDSDNERLLDIPGGKREVEVYDDVKIVTAPYKTNVEIDVLGISQTQELLSKGYMDETDSLNGSVIVNKVYFELTGKNSDGDDVTEYHSRELFGIPAAFTNTLTGNSKEIQLNYNTKSLAWIGGKITKADGTATEIDDLANLTEGYVVKVGMKLKGDGQVQKGTIIVHPLEIKLISVTDANGNELPEDDDIYTKMKDIFDVAKVVAYELDAYANNTNARYRGKLITRDTYTYKYSVPTRVKIRELTPVYNNGNDGDVPGLLGQIDFNRKALNKHGLLELFKTAAILRNYPEDSEEFGISSKLVNKKFVETDINLASLVNSIKSSDRVGDIESALKLTIRNIAIELFTKTNYNLALESLMPGVKPTIIIGTDTNIGRFVSSFEDELFNYTVAISNDNLMTGKLVMSFGIMGGSRHKEPHPLNFGVCFWSPETAISLQRQENGTIKQETIIMPRFLHQTVLPIMAVCEVTGIEEVSGQLPVFTKSV